MALSKTTLTSACAAGDQNIVVASATGFAAGAIVKIDDEDMVVTKGYVAASLTVPVLRGRDGSAAVAHPVTATVIVGAATDTEWSTEAPQTDVSFPIAGKAETYTSYSASGAITLPKPGSNAIAVINAVSTTIIAMTVAVPTKAMDGCRLLIASRNGTGAHTVTVSGGLNGAGSAYDVFTFPAGPVMIELIALNELWYVVCSPAMTGTVTLLVGGIA